MISTGGYDFMLQFNEDLLNDILARVLNDPLTLAGSTTYILPRQLAYPGQPQQAKTMLWWDQPAYRIDEQNPPDVVTVAIPIHGGVQAQQNIYSVAGVVQVLRQAHIATAGGTTPYVTLEEMGPWALDMRHLRFSYGDTPQSPQPLIAGTSGYLLGGLSILLTTLARVPFSFTIGSLFFHVGSQRAPSATSIPPYMIDARRATVRNVKTRDLAALALGISLDDTVSAHTVMTDPLPQRAHPTFIQRLFKRDEALNATLTISTAGINGMLRQLQSLGALQGAASTETLDSPVNGQPVATIAAWRWEDLVVTFQEDMAELAGRFTINATTTPVRASVRCLLDEQGRLIVQPQTATSNADAAIAAAVAHSWKAILLKLLRVETPASTAPDMLMQRFLIPQTQIALDVPARVLVVTAGEMTLGYAVPQSFSGIVRQVVAQIS